MELICQAFFIILKSTSLLYKVIICVDQDEEKEIEIP